MTTEREPLLVGRTKHRASERPTWNDSSPLKSGRQGGNDDAWCPPWTRMRCMPATEEESKPLPPHRRDCLVMCQRLGLECVGSGERRYLFVEQKCRRRQPDQHQANDLPTGQTISRPALSSASVLTGATKISPPLPQTELQMLIGAFVYTIAPTTVRANLVQTYGPFLEMVPSRLGTNAALDNSTRAVVCAHQDVCRGRPATEESLAHYSLAIRTLSLCLNSLDTARSTETVCAVIMLIMCERQAVGRIRDCLEVAFAGDDAPLLAVQWFQGLWRRELRTDPARFESLVSGLFGGDDEEEEEAIFMRRVQIPRLLARAGEARRSRIGSLQSSGIFSELHALYERFRGHSQNHPAPLTAAVAAPLYLGVPPLSAYGFRLLVACVCSCMLRGLLKGQQPESPFEDTLSREAEDLADTALLLAMEAAKGRNIGTGHVVINCFLAWVCTGDAAKRARIQSVYDEFMRPFSRAWVDGKVVAMWEVLASDLFLLSDP
ncbi:hypothetical protein PG996_005010 [Apiospora saccharicola]|uniref:Uncharacterized protein n=1 Tax=Apiospora saccharicola TaxID=335842 RepID=A0ABR1VLD0_9PEZI